MPIIIYGLPENFYKLNITVNNKASAKANKITKIE
jgi:hypothetical protein